ncbi:branched-chain alpha-keto acid dehydrogenase subunit E2 [compost metagenome]
MARVVDVRVPRDLWPRRPDWRGKVVAVHVSPGLSVAAGDPVAEVEIEKAVLVLESPVSGVVVDVLVSVGDDVGPGDAIARIEVRE